ncbi:carboxypeptidase regulatory-like domain-containing protein [Deinococcus sp. HMF7620]|uniref:Carboxypeptidase regulatory-like domain-containing protein n=1 Tax=Deinococcus arboris TaxID=2682977 RepID=A0A7C9HXF2_9DEIO|nr:Ig-like domain-containing protein [Deinococcus arboris]MVN86410.1 carboxypeptidase regulatory-like domain-containing protein [Deinococcus arboris]
MALKPLSVGSAFLLGTLLIGCNPAPTPVADTTAPTITLSATPSPVTANGTFTLKATASDNVAVTKVEFYDGATKLGEDTTAPYELPVNVTIANNGKKTYTATAYDAAGNKASASFEVTVNITDVTAPTVTLSAAPNPVTAAGTTTLTATATDDVGVAKVEFYEGATKLGEDTTAPYTLPVVLNAVQNGKKTYTATAYDAAGNKTSASTDVTVNITSTSAPLRGTVVDQHIGAPVAGSTITVMQGNTTLGTVTTDANGQFSLPGLTAGTYDLAARKTGMAGSNLYGVTVGTETPSVELVQRPAFDTAVSPEPAKLTLTRADGSALAGATFTNNVDFKIVTNADYTGPIRIMYAQLGRTPGSGVITSAATANNWNFSPPQDKQGAVDSGAVTVPNAASPNFIAGFGSAAGETVYLQVMVVDFNYNYSRYVVPIKLINTNSATANTVVAPTAAAATAFTLKQEGSWTTPYSVPGVDAAPNGSGVFVEVRWCYTDTSAAARPFAFDIERSSDGTTFSKIGTVGGGSSASCSATNQATRPFNFRDTSAELTAGKTFTYRVKARGANTVASNTTQTTPLAQFQPTFIAPGDETTGVSINPTFVLGQNQTAIGADGAAYNIRLRDLMTQTGYNLPGAAGNALIRVEEGTGPNGNGIAAGQSLVFLSTGAVLGAPTAAANVLTDTSAKYGTVKNLYPVDTTAHTVSMPWNVLVAAPLQPLRPYKWEMYSGIAYKYAPTEGNRISAYSTYTWAADANGNPVAPINQTRPVNINWDFITGEK